MGRERTVSCVKPFLFIFALFFLLGLNSYSHGDDGYPPGPVQNLVIADVRMNDFWEWEVTLVWTKSFGATDYIIRGSYSPSNLYD